MRLRPAGDAEARTTFDSTFERILQSERDPPLPVTCVAEASEAFEIMFVPMHDLVAQRGADGKWSYQKVPCFWCYRVVPGAIAAAIKWMSMFRVPVVLDLDDTLVVANGEGALRDKREKVRCPWLPSNTVCARFARVLQTAAFRFLACFLVRGSCCISPRRL